MSPVPTVTKTPPTGYRGDDSKLHGLDFNDPDTIAWARAKYGRYLYDQAQREHHAHTRRRQIKRRMVRASRRANR